MITELRCGYAFFFIRKQFELLSSLYSLLSIRPLKSVEHVRRYIFPLVHCSNTATGFRLRFSFGPPTLEVPEVSCRIGYHRTN